MIEKVQSKRKKEYNLFWLYPLCLAAVFYLLGFFKLGLEPVLVVIVTVGLYPLLKAAISYQKKMESKNKVFTGVYTGILSLALMGQRAIVYTGNMKGSYTENLFTGIGPGEILMALCAFVVLFAIHINLICMLDFLSVSLNKTEGKSKRKLSNRQFYWLVFAGLFLSWGICWLTYFPGISFVDMYYIILKPVQISIQHPFFYNMLLSGLLSLGESVFGSVNGGVALYCFVQLTVAALSVAYCIGWIRKKGSPFIFTFAVCLFFMITPFFAVTSVFITKDVFFGVFVMLFVPLLYDLWESGGQLLKNKGYVLKLSGLSIITALVRNNGVYVLLALALFMILFFFKKRKELFKGFITYVLLGIVLPVVLSNGAMKFIVKGSPYFQESIAIPLQQIARTVVKNGDTIPLEQQEFVYSIYPKEAYLEHYTPMTVDSLKWSTNPHADVGRYFLQSNKKAFLLNWAKLLPNNFGTYVEAYLMETYGFWSLSGQNEKAFPASSKKLEELGISNRQIWPDGMQKGLDQFYSSNYRMLAEGNLFWLTLFLFLFVLVSKNPQKVLVFIPVMAVWITLMISVPIAFSIRYMYPFAYALPFLVHIALAKEQKDSDKLSINRGSEK